MWISQSYIGKAGLDAKVFVYYLFGQYEEKVELTKTLQKELSDLAYLYGEELSIFLPQDDYKNQINKEVNDLLRNVTWHIFSNKKGLPGFLISSFSFFDAANKNKELNLDELYYIPLPSNLEESKKLIKLIKDQTEFLLINPEKVPASNFYQKIINAIEAKPTFMGFGIDIRKIIGK